MSVFSNKKENFTIKILNNIDGVNNILKESGYLLKSYNYDLEIYMINKNENFSKIKRLEDIKEYAIIKDENGNRKVLLNSETTYEAKVYSIFLIHDLLYNLGFYELFYINKDIYSYEKFDILDVKGQGCFLKCCNITLDCLKDFIFELKEIGINIDNKSLKVDIIQNELNKSLFNRKK